MAENDFDFVVVGGGPAGVAAAVRAAKLGRRVCTIEQLNYVGGCCVNLGCVPTKSMCFNTHYFSDVKQHARQHAVEIQDMSFDLAQMHRLKDEARHVQQQYLARTLRDSGVTLVTAGAARLVSGTTVEVTTADEKEKKTINAKNILVCTGSFTADLPFLPIDEKRILSSNGCMELREVPHRMTIVGAGAIGLELGSVWSRLGSQVEFVEMLPIIGSEAIDEELAALYVEELRAQGMRFNLSCKLTAAHVTEHNICLQYETATGEQHELCADVVLVSVGRKSATAGLGLKEIGVKLDRRGAILVNDVCQSVSVPTVFAAGDCTPGPMVAHKSTMEANAVVDHLFGGTRPQLHYGSLPFVVYTQPEAAWVGPSEQRLRSESRHFVVYRFRYNSNMRDTLCPTLDGFVKVIVDADSQKVLSVFILGATSGDLIAEAVLAVRLGATMDDYGNCPHVHPFYKSLNEMYRVGATEPGPAQPRL
eukprot:TRINITY_DN1182_c0_g1_i2.p1 TRINITY_DN1182_c0_g1~~TRINITY_DN1182_c0_g1_i2.p1  ORF type:complete len:490 (-),score=102.53 TRINITY_DN1182_c0_g1_i2:57-1487(-)